MTYAYKYVPATQAGLVAMLTPVFNVIIALSLFREEMSGVELTGAALIVLSCFAVFYFEGRRSPAKTVESSS
jgi:drug/metabolite transporter (DMT)-like permease